MVSRTRKRPGFLFLLTVIVLVGGLVSFVFFSGSPGRRAAGKQFAAPISNRQSAPEDIQQFMKRIRQFARQTQGDWTQLSPQDQQLLDGYTGGHGRSMFSMLATEQLSGTLARPASAQ